MISDWPLAKRFGLVQVRYLWLAGMVLYFARVWWIGWRTLAEVVAAAVPLRIATRAIVYWTPFGLVVGPRRAANSGKAAGRS